MTRIIGTKKWGSALAASAALAATLTAFTTSAATLTHRWSFNGTTDAQNLTDSVGGVVAKKMKKSSNTTTVEGGTVNWANGAAVLPGGNGVGHLNFGEGILGTGNAATLEVWVKKTRDLNAWEYFVNYGIIDATTANHLSLAVGRGSGDATRWGLTENRVAGNDKGGAGMISPPIGITFHVTLSLKDNGDGSTTARWTIRDAATGFILSDQKNVNLTGWTLASAAADHWALLLGNNPWTNGMQDLPCEIDEVRIWDGILSDDQHHANVLAGPDLVLGGSLEGVAIASGETFTVPTIGDYGYRTDTTVRLGAGAKIRFDTTDYFGNRLRFKTGGIVVPSGSVLDYVELSDPDNYVATMEDANTILVQLKSTIPYESTWIGGTPSSAADLANAANWTSVDASGTAISAAPGAKTTVILPAATLAAFTVPDGATVNWGRVLFGGHTATQCGRYGSKINAKLSEFLDVAIGSYASLGALGIDTINGNATSWQNSNIVNAQVRFDGWFYATAAQSGRWDLKTDFDDVTALAIDGEWVFVNPKWEPNDLTAGCFVSEGWHRFTFLAGDTGGGKGCEVTVNGTMVPFSISINGGSTVAFHTFTFGTDANTVQLSQACDWRALGEIDVSSGLTIDLNGHNLAVTDITRSTLGASITNSSVTAAALYVVQAVSSSNAKASGIASVPIVQYGSKSAIWSGAANDGNPLTSGNWSITSGAGMAIPDGIPDAATEVTIAGPNVNLQIPSGSVFRCASLNIVGGTFTADCDWRGLAVTPSITGTADLNGHDLRLSHLTGVAGSAFSNGASGVSSVRFDAVNGTDMFDYSNYISGVAPATSQNAKIVIEKSDGGAWSMSQFDLAGLPSGYLEGVVSAGSLTSSGSAVTIGANGYGELTVDGGNVTFEKGLNLPGNRSTTGIMNIKSGNLTSTGYVDFGGTGGKESWIVQSGGTVTLSGASWFGRFNGGPAIYELSAGTFSQTGGSLHLGQISGGVCHFNQSGGRMTVGNVEFILAYNGSSGTFTQTGGELVSEHEIWVGRDGTAAFNVGGTVTLATGKGLSLGHRVAGSTGSFTLNDGGVLTTSYLRKGAGTAKATFAGGKIVAKDANNASDFIRNISDVTYADGGLTVDTAGYNVTMQGNTVTSVERGSALVKTGAGTLTTDDLPPVDTVKVEQGTLTLASGADIDNSQGVTKTLAHRWSFNGDYGDSVGNVTATQLGNAMPPIVNGEVVMPGGAGAGSLSLGTGTLGSGEATIEIWATQTTLRSWHYIFGYGVNDVEGSDMLAWAWRNGANSYDNASLDCTGVEGFWQNRITELADLGTEYHFAITFTDNGDDTTSIKFSRRNPTNVAEVVSRTFTVANWNLARGSSTWELSIGHNPFSNSTMDASARYNEVRVWHSALSDEELAFSATLGPDATASEIAQIANPVASRTLAVVSGGTLDLGGRTLTQPVVTGNGGTVRNGTLNANEIRLNVGDCLTVGSGTLNIDGAKVNLLDPENLATTFWFIQTASGGRIEGTPVADPALPTGWTIRVTSGGAKLTKGGFSIHLR